MSHGAVKSSRNGNGVQSVHGGQGGQGEQGECSREGSQSLPPPPDGGWGWVVVFASFMIHIISHCHCRPLTTGPLSRRHHVGS
ncbi:hypothetical protein RR48_11535 [Papilio machaon]|uniref:Uncharacterized protein n=1 Tax=Papilio machaon TaxID=76193 RepID=A0A194R427_PAPMA|nr:hypothetical protein RR48_11535 [Papilio machaon]